jgi:flavin-dependent dehydrogenase
MSNPQIDVLVLGGGPSGCAAAILLARGGLSVALLERTNYAGNRIGETVAPQAVPFIARLGLNETLQAVPRLVSSGVQSLWGTTTVTATDFFFHPYGCGLHVDRARFDAAIASQAEQVGVAVWRNARSLACRRLDAHWEVTSAVAEVTRRFVAGWIVDATGRSAWFARRFGQPPCTVDRLVAIVARIENCELEDQRLAVEALPDGWIYSAPLPDGKGVVALMTDSDLLPPLTEIHRYWQRQLAQSRLVAPRFGSLGRPRLRLMNAATQYCPKALGHDWIAVGDAAASFDPLSGIGICWSLNTAFEAARTISAVNAGDEQAPGQYQIFVDSKVRSLLSQKTQLYRLVGDWSDREFWRRRIGQGASVPLAADPL